MNESAGLGFTRSEVSKETILMTGSVTTFLIQAPQKKDRVKLILLVKI